MDETSTTEAPSGMAGSAYLQAKKCARTLTAEDAIPVLRGCPVHAPSADDAYINHYSVEAIEPFPGLGDHALNFGCIARVRNDGERIGTFSLGLSEQSPPLPRRCWQRPRSLLHGRTTGSSPGHCRSADRQCYSSAGHRPGRQGSSAQEPASAFGRAEGLGRQLRNRCLHVTSLEKGIEANRLDAGDDLHEASHALLLVSHSGFRFGPFCCPIRATP